MISMDWLKKRRKQLGLSQEEFASRLQLSGYDVSRASVGHWESGRARPQLDNPVFMKAFSDALEMDVNSVLRLSGYNVITQYSSTVDQIAAIASKLPEEKQRLALALIEQLAKA